ncbi:MAG: L-lactate dehydrogenase [Oscillospiraceae bacterium]|nr:L-lactate dehydrogenase [Oscillospiraceae bacterium]
MTGQGEGRVNSRKAAVIGCGFVGSASAFALMQSGLFSEMVLIDARREKAEGEALDISHGLPFAQPMRIYAGDYDDIGDAAIVVLSAGVNQKPGETRLDLVRKNAAVFQSILPELLRRDFGGILLIVTNPVDILTCAALRLSGLPEKRVFGSGTVLDTARMQYLLGEHLGVDPRNVHAFIIGEHGDSEIAAWSSANIEGVPLNDFCEMRGFYRHVEAMQRLAEEVRQSADKIIERKQATYFGIAMSVRRICAAIIRDEKSVLPVSWMQHGAYGLEGVALSMPAVIGKSGIEAAVPIRLDGREALALRDSAAKLEQVRDQVFGKS